MNITRIPILGLSVSVVDMKLVLTKFVSWIETQQSNYVCVAPAHSLMECIKTPTLLPVFNDAGLITPDGIAVVWLMRLKGYKQVQRVYGPDLLLAACVHGLELGWRHYFLGGAPETNAKLIARLNAQYPGIKIAGAYSPPFRPLSQEEHSEMILKVNQSQADLVWVGLGSPRQEIWMHANRDKILAPVLVGVGAAFDFLSGAKPQAPRWIQRIGMEWLFRLLCEPKRLWPRYRQYPLFVCLALQDLIAHKLNIKKN
jgi:N-acetylglucosaminyldiphosphoundecaprenol N-acetyl-beta-D-mannosaminyltransferase